jgi:hypothetical protein
VDVGSTNCVVLMRLPCKQLSIGPFSWHGITCASQASGMAKLLFYGLSIPPNIFVVQAAWHHHKEAGRVSLWRSLLVWMPSLQLSWHGAWRNTCQKSRFTGGSPYKVWLDLPCLQLSFLLVESLVCWGVCWLCN